MRLPAHKRFACAIAAGAIATGVTLAQQDPAPGGLRHARLYEVASSKTLSTVNRNDAQAALKVWAANGIAGLRGKRVLVSSRTRENAGIAWLDVLLGKEGLGRASSFFTSMKVTEKSQGCILPVFFGTVDACVVDVVNLDLARELNPQLGQFRVLARSQPMIENVIATPVETHPYMKEWTEAMLTAQDNPRGRQILLVFKIDRLVLIRPGDLDSGRELWKEYFRLPGSTPNKTPVSPPMSGQIFAP